MTPYLPEYGKAPVHVVQGNFPACYDYLNDDNTHLNHRIKTKKSYGLDGNISIHNVRLISWYAQLPWMRLPVLPIQWCEGSFRGIIDELNATPTAGFEPSELQDYLDRTLKDVIRQLKKALQEISPSNSRISFEALCERLVTEEGYKCVDRHVYNREGGDVDLQFTRERGEASPFERGETRLHVQVKKHAGTTDEWAVQQILGIIRQEADSDGCVMSLADDFSPPARDLAESNGVLLMDGDAICKLLLKSLVG